MTLFRRTAASLLVTALAGAGIAMAAVPAEAATSAYRYWSYWYAGPAATAWTYGPIGPAGHPVVDGAVEGWRFVVAAPNPDAPPPRHSASTAFKDICAGTARPTGKVRVAVVVDFGTAADAPPTSRRLGVSPAHAWSSRGAGQKDSRRWPLPPTHRGRARLRLVRLPGPRVRGGRQGTVADPLAQTEQAEADTVCRGLRAVRYPGADHRSRNTHVGRLPGCGREGDDHPARLDVRFHAWPHSGRGVSDARAVRERGPGAGARSSGASGDSGGTPAGLLLGGALVLGSGAAAVLRTRSRNHAQRGAA